MNLLIFLITVPFLGCQTVSSDFVEARRLEKEGQLSQAFDLYVKLEQQYPGTSISKKSSVRLQKIYLDYAKEQEASDPAKAIQLYQKMLERWPQDTIAIEVEQKIEKLKKNKLPEMKEKVDSNQDLETKEKEKDEDALFCEKAKDSASRIVWQQYKQQYPEGKCFEAAENFLQGSQPRDSELDEMRTIAKECQSALKSACQEYNLSKTTSDATACIDANRSFSNELQRLIRRKRTLLADGNKEFYQKFIPKRWNSVKSGIASACQKTQNFILEKEGLGIDTAPFKTILEGQCDICLEDFGDIEDL